MVCVYLCVKLGVFVYMHNCAMKKKEKEKK